MRVAVGGGWLGGTVLALFATIGAHGTEPPKPTDPESKPAAPPKAVATEDPALPLVPKNPVSAEEKAKLEAEKLYVIGLGQLDRRELVPAMHTFEQALEHDPKSLPVLRELVPLALQLGDPRRGLDYCKRALELDPKNYRLLLLLAGREAEAGRLEPAIELLQKAAVVEEVLHDDPRAYLQIRGDLIQLLGTLQRSEETIAPLQELQKLADDPDKYHLSEFARRQLDRRRFSDNEQLGRALAKAGRFDEAVRTLERGRESADPRAKRLSLALAEVYFDKGDLEKASNELNAYMTAGMQNRDALSLYARILDKQGRKEELRPQLSRWLESDQENPVLREFYAEQLLEAGEFEEAEKQLGRVHRARGSSVALLAKLYRKLNQPAKLLAALVESDRNRPEGPSPEVNEQIEALAKDPAMVEAVAKAARELPADSPDRFPAQFVIARIASQAKLADLAIEFLTLCVNERPTVVPLQSALLDLLWRNKRYTELLDAVERAEKANPGQKAEFLEAHARALEQTGRPDEAVALLDAFIKDSAGGPEALVARLELARVFMQMEKFDKAVETCRAIIADYPDSPQASYTKYLLGSVLGQKGDTHESERILLELLEDPTINDRLAATVNNDLGYTWADQGKNLDRAEVLIRKALDAQPGQAAYLDSLGWVKFKRGDYAEAVKFLKQATSDEDGQDAVIYDHLGDALIKLDKVDEARKSWEKALELLANPKTRKEREQRTQIEKKIRLLAGPETTHAK